MNLPSELGSWDHFVAEWCHGTPPDPPPAEVAAALNTLKRYRPDFFGSLIYVRARSNILIGIDQGRVLQACEVMPGFDRILPRIRRGDRSAISEAEYAAALASLGHQPQLEPKVGTSVVDNVVFWEGFPIYTEVIAPDTAEAIVSAQTEMKALAESIADSRPGLAIEVLLETDITAEASATVLGLICEHPGNTQMRIEGLATLVARPASLPLELMGPNQIQYDGSGPVLASSAGRIRDGVGTTATVRMPLSDDRAQRLLHKELHHFSRSTHNILAIDTGNLTVGPRDWAPFIRKSFQPTLNRRIGAVVLFARALVSFSKLRQFWTVISNQYAYQPIPPTFLASVSGLDQFEQGHQ
jgi:hypothetical protein